MSPQFTQGSSWLHARVGRRTPLGRRQSRGGAQSWRRNAATPPVPALRPTVYLPSATL
jgi:hypothetical protein